MSMQISTKQSKKKPENMKLRIRKKEGIDTRNDATRWYSRQKKHLEEVGDKIDARDKAAVEADVQALKDLLAKANRRNDRCSGC